MKVGAKVEWGKIKQPPEGAVSFHCVTVLLKKSNCGYCDHDVN